MLLLHISKCPTCAAAFDNKKKHVCRTPAIPTSTVCCTQVSYKLAWTAISSLLTQYSKQHGPDILLWLNVCYFFPSIPVLVLQTAFNDRCGHGAARMAHARRP